MVHGALEHSDAKTFIGIDVGGTHTDAIVVRGDDVIRAKAFTTEEDYSRGVQDALAIAAEEAGMSVETLLSGTEAFVNATTLVTNAVTELKGGRVGVLVTRGFRDVFRIARGPRQNVYDDHAQTNVPDVVPRECIVEVTERVDGQGAALVSLNEGEVLDGVRYLVEEQGIEALAIGFLWSFRNTAHELRAREIVRDEFPDLPLTLSHEIHPVIREYERWNTAVFNAFVHRQSQLYLDRIEQTLRERGLTNRLAFFQGLGGTLSPEQARTYPLFLMGSGPAGGVAGAIDLARELGLKRVICGDMGGTSFDTTLVQDYEVEVAKRRAFGEMETGLNILDIVSIGAGGGSIVSIDSRGIPQVGPRSAGADPGPVCYGRGGTEPTVTDAAVILGLIDPRDYLAGRVDLDVAGAERAIDETVASEFGWSTQEAAAGIYDLVVTNMSNALREVTVAKGHDPREFTLLGYGGTLPLFAATIARRMGIRDVLLPASSSVFSARGLLAADFVRRHDRTVEVMMSSTGGDVLGEVNKMANELIAATREELAGEGFDDDDMLIARSGDFRFAGQVWELSMPLPDRDLTPEDGPALAEEFVKVYERNYGEGTAWAGSEVMLLNYTITAIGKQAKPTFPRYELADSSDAGPAEVDTRDVYLPGRREQVSVPIYADERFEPGFELMGPAVINAHDTTIYVPEDVHIRRDEYRNYLLTVNT
jgi:N-methylhydantoinase A